MRFEEKLRKLMLERGFNQQRLARASGVSDSEVSRILTGKSSNPGVENALKLARAVGASLDYLADDALDQDPSRAPAAPAGAASGPAETEILESARELGLRHARHILETVRFLGTEVALARLMGLPPVIEVADPPRPVTAAAAAGHPGERRASSA